MRSRKNQKSRVRAEKTGATILSLLLLFSGAAKGAPPAHLPIYLEDSHAGSFYWFARNLPPDEEATLILFDAHSDASQAFDSDGIREAIRQGGSLDDTLSRWREKGAIQCFNWIEPLMPSPFARVIWVPPGNFDRSTLLAEVEREINAHQLTVPRSGEDLVPRFEVMSETELAESEFSRPVVVTLDLDFFAGSSDEKIEADFHRTWDSLFRLPDLRAITGAISTPYLKSPEQADRLVSLFLEGALDVANAKIQWEPFASTGPDRSRRAKELIRKGENIPAFVPEKASPRIRALVAANRERIRIYRDFARWKELTAGWHTPEIQVTGRREDEDGCVRIRKGSGTEVRLVSTSHDELPVKWEVLKSENPVYNLLGKGTRFADDAPRWIRWKTIPLAAERPWLDAGDLAPFLDPGTGCGTLRIRATIGETRSNTLVLRFSRSDGFRGAVEESFQLPYLLGGSRLADGGLTGSDLALGGDCANLAVYAIRRSNQHLRWMTPVEFRPHTETIQSFSPADLDLGIFADFGSHLAVLMEDLPPQGTINDEDLFAHQLEGAPEIVPFKTLSDGRRPPRIRRLSPPAETVSLIFGGDTMLSRTVGEAIRKNVASPFQSVLPQLQTSDLAIVNLECSLTKKQNTNGSQIGFNFPAPPECAELLAQAGIDFVSLATNHAADSDIHESTSLIKAAGVTPFGQPGSPFTEVERKGLHIALAGWQPGDSFDPVRNLASHNDCTIVFAHWGTEYEVGVDEIQLASARKLVEAGANLIVGSGPHCVQKSDVIEKTPVYYSLGNFVFDGDGPNKKWKKGMLLRVELDTEGRIVSRLTIPVTLGSEGFPSPD